jgi:hypothetical protein
MTGCLEPCILTKSIKYQGLQNQLRSVHAIDTKPCRHETLQRIANKYLQHEYSRTILNKPPVFKQRSGEQFEIKKPFTT